MQKVLIILGVVLIVVGLGWPWLSKIPFGRLPGDIVIDKPTLKVYFPVTTMIIISLLLSLLMRFFNK
ncbi:MAG: DUF2905 domain-containing protein [Desulfuromonas sp.]|nr:MAG: DUF2905 domain-containing protein [Desulfuromonas sp.]